MDYFWLLWLVAGVVFLAIETHHAQFFAIFIAMGFFAAALVDLAGLSLWWQGPAFVVVTLGGTATMRGYLVSRFHRNSPSLILPGVHGGFLGQHAITVDTVGDEHHPGHAVLAGETWLAVTDALAPLSAETPVVVAGMRGTTLLVRPLGA